MKHLLSSLLFFSLLACDRATMHGEGSGSVQDNLRRYLVRVRRMKLDFWPENSTFNSPSKIVVPMNFHIFRGLLQEILSIFNCSKECIYSIQRQPKQETTFLL